MLASVSIFARQILHLDDESYRNFFEPPPYYRLALVLDVLIVAGLAVVVAGLVRSTGSEWLRRGFARLFFLLIGSSLMGTIPILEDHPTALFVCWSLFAIYLFTTWILRADRFVAPFKRLCLMVSPAGPLVLLQLGGWAEFSPPPVGSRVATVATVPSTPIFVLLFDEWSYQRTVLGVDGRRPSLPNFDGFAARSFNFTNARSQNDSTAYSVPHFLFQTRRTLDFRKRRFVLEGDVHTPVTADTSSLFKTAHDHGYATAVAGWHIPYQKLLGDQADIAINPTPWPAVGGFGGSMLRGFAENLRYSYDPLVRIARRIMVVQESLWRTKELEKKCMALIEKSSANSFTFFHFPLPHDPFVYKSDGTPAFGFGDESPLDYVQQLEYTDRVLGRFVDGLKRRDFFEKSLVIVMSDHSWRNESDPEILAGRSPYLKVPLLVKWPRQSTPKKLEFPVVTTWAGELIELAMEGGSEQDAFERITKWGKP